MAGRLEELARRVQILDGDRDAANGDREAMAATAAAHARALEELRDGLRTGEEERSRLRNTLVRFEKQLAIQADDNAKLAAGLLDRLNGRA